MSKQKLVNAERKPMPKTAPANIIHDSEGQNVYKKGGSVRKNPWPKNMIPGTK